MIKHLESSKNFENSVKEGICLVDFYADWCGPCKMQSLVLDEIDFCDIIKINVDDMNDISKQFGIMSIPTLILFKDGSEVCRMIGYQELADIQKNFMLIK